jgi:hypothetical protein
MQALDLVIKEALDGLATELESLFNGHLVSYNGPIEPRAEPLFLSLVEGRKNAGPPVNKLVILLTTLGGSAETVEKLVNIARHHYEELVFVIPEKAMSAGTIFCMAGDEIYMDYSSALGPIDPQVFNGKDWVPALGYLDKYNEMIDKAQNGTLTHAEAFVMQSQDLAMLSSCEQARNLTITLLKRWLVRYKFAKWTVHETTKTEVTPEEKEKIAELIALKLGNNQKWHSHGRYINMTTLQEDVGVKIKDLFNDTNLRKTVRAYHDLVLDYKNGRGFPLFLHSKNYF